MRHLKVAVRCECAWLRAAGLVSICTLEFCGCCGPQRDLLCHVHVCVCVCVLPLFPPPSQLGAPNSGAGGSLVIFSSSNPAAMASVDGVGGVASVAAFAPFLAAGASSGKVRVVCVCMCTPGL
jgi:hypothetical protein